MTGNIGQSDAPLGNGRWQTNWWRPDLYLHDRYIIPLPEPFNPAQHKIYIGLYDAQTSLRLPIVNTPNETDYWELAIEN